MTQNQEFKDIASSFSDEWAARWMEEHLPELRQAASGQRLLYQGLAMGFVVGLAAHIGGYLLLLSAPSGLLGLLADLLHALGWSLWTGAVVALFVQVWPEVKRRQIKQAVDAYEAARPAARKQGQKRTQSRDRKRV